MRSAAVIPIDDTDSAWTAEHTGLEGARLRQWIRDPWYEEFGPPDKTDHVYNRPSVRSMVNGVPFLR